VFSPTTHSRLNRILLKIELGEIKVIICKSDLERVVLVGENTNKGVEIKQLLITYYT
jgi:hypothetical protein